MMFSSAKHILLRLSICSALLLESSYAATCDVSCKDCSADDSPDHCTSCNDGYFIQYRFDGNQSSLLNEQFLLETRHDRYDTALEDYYDSTAYWDFIVNSVDSATGELSTSLSTTSETAEVTTTSPPVEPSNFTCVQNCTDGFYGNTESGTCLLCSEQIQNCEKCQEEWNEKWKEEGDEEEEKEVFDEANTSTNKTVICLECAADYVTIGNRCQQQSNNDSQWWIIVVVVVACLVLIGAVAGGLAYLRRGHCPPTPPSPPPERLPSGQELSFCPEYNNEPLEKRRLPALPPQAESRESNIYVNASAVETPADGDSRGASVSVSVPDERTSYYNYRPPSNGEPLYRNV